MKHPSTRALFTYWNERRGHRPAPERGDIDPAAIRQTLGDVFMLAADFVDELRFRLAGTRVCALFGREIKGESFASAWSEMSRKAIDDLIEQVTGETVGAVAGLTGRADDGAELDLELLLLPLAHTGHARIRAIGVLAPLAPPYWLGEKPVTQFALGTVRHVGRGIPGAPRLVPAVDGSQARHGFLVYTGGRATGESGG